VTNGSRIRLLKSDAEVGHERALLARRLRPSEGHERHGVDRIGKTQCQSQPRVGLRPTQYGRGELHHLGSEDPLGQLVDQHRLDTGAAGDLGAEQPCQLDQLRSLIPIGSRMGSK
jgi:hypothetical protein